MEFGLTECLPIYSGGLGILAGDHLKSASELGVPLVGVGLLYQKGYFRQYLNPEGWQQERYPINDFFTMPVRPCRDADGKEVRVAVSIAGREAQIRPWRAQVGRVTLVLLDTNLAENPSDIQDITDELYGGDAEMRIQQEIVLGIGGMRTLDALGLRARVYHMNEGHSAFLALERLARLMHENTLSLPEAWEVVAASTVFTTHTPVPAGIDVFAPDLIERYFGPYLQELGTNRDLFLGLGRVHPDDAGEPFNMAVTAIRIAGYVNGVSRLHGKVSRAMWRDLWPAIPIDELPISYITNGVHPGSWISDDMRTLYDRYLGPRGPRSPATPACGRRSSRSPARSCGERTSGAASVSWRSRAAAWSSSSAAAAPARPSSPAPPKCSIPRRSPSASHAGSPRTSGPPCCSRDPERLARLLNDPDRPVQIIFAGKAHPRDDAGQGVHPRHRPARPAPRVPPPHRVSRGLRHDRRPLPGAGRGRLAEHAAAPAGGQRYQRHEGRVQRRARICRSSTAGGTRRTSRRSAGPSAAARSTPTWTTRTASSPARCTTCSRTKSCRCSTRGRATGCRAGGSRR